MIRCVSSMAVQVGRGGGNAMERAMVGAAQEMQSQVGQVRNDMTELRQVCSHPFLHSCTIPMTWTDCWTALQGMEILHDSIRQLYELLGPVVSNAKK